MNRRADPETLLRVSAEFLRQRELHDCKKYALQAQQSDPTLPGLSQILAVANVLLAGQTQTQTRNYYSILNLEPFSNDKTLITENFKTLFLLLNPTRNHYPFAGEASQLVRNAWQVLSDPLKKTEFDNLLKESLNNVNGNNECGDPKKVETFWTVCPYCYYVYEYPKVYEDCCLRCWNEKCGRGFHGMAISLPPVNALRDGKYLWSGVFPVGNGFSLWPSSEPVMGKSGGNHDGDNVGFGNADYVVEISDDSSEDSLCGGPEDDKPEVNSEERENVEPMVSKQVMRRKKKSVRRNSKKVTGTGFRVRKPKVVDQTDEGGEGELDLNMKTVSGVGFRVRKQDLIDQTDQGGEEELDSNAETSDGGEYIGFGCVGGMELAVVDDLVTGDVEFFDGIDDIFVGLEGI